MSGSPPPRHLQPMLATAGEMPKDEAAWAFEVKWDGIRALARVDGADLGLESRNQADITPRYPELAGLAPALAGRAVILDGEIIAVDAAGRPSFELLQRRMHLRDRAEIRLRVRDTPATYVVFDLLWDGGSSLMDLPYHDRRSRLVEVLDEIGRRSDGGLAVRLAPSLPGEGAALFEATREQGLEGVVAKRLASPYEAGRRSRAWIKVKHFHHQELVVGGWVPGHRGRGGRIGALMLGYHADDGVLHYAGKVGTGFSGAELDRLARLLAPLARSTSPFDITVPDAAVARFVEPVLVVEVRLGHWTAAGQIRHSAYVGLRDDKAAADVRRE